MDAMREEIEGQWGGRKWRDDRGDGAMKQEGVDDGMREER